MTLIRLGDASVEYLQKAAKKFITHFLDMTKNVRKTYINTKNC